MTSTSPQPVPHTNNMNQQATMAPQQDAEVIIVGGGPVGMGLAIEPVSYTHLTLPTICSV